MTKVLEIKERIVRFCGEYEIYLKFVYKFVLALALFCLINGSIGFMESISTFSIALLLALVCCLLPQSMTLLVAAGLVVANLYVLSMEVAITAVMLIILVTMKYRILSAKH